MSNLKPCPCGRPIDDLFISHTNAGGKWAFVSGDCCGEWMIEFRANYLPLESDECKCLAREAWNNAPRKYVDAAIDHSSETPEGR